MAAQRLLDDRCLNVVGPEGIVLAENLERLLERLLGQRFQGESVGFLEELPEEAADAIGSILRDRD